MRAGLFGGSFDPPHVGHLAIAECAREEACLDVVVWMPAFRPPHKAGPDPAHRLAMTRLAARGNAAFEVSDAEIVRGGVSFTVDTLRALRERHPDREWRLIVGGDSFSGLAGWKDPDGILSMACLVVYPRRGSTTTGARGAHILDAPLLDVSSSDLRERIRAGRTARYLVPDAVLAYIEDHGLYR